MITRFFAVPLCIAFGFALLAGPLSAQAEEETKATAQQRQELHKDVQSAIAQFKKADPGIERFLKDSAGYAVFPRVGKMGFIFAGAHGAGELFESGRVVGTASITLGTIGLQAGIQEFSQIVFFKDRAAFDRFKENKFEFAANASAVIATAGASKGANYENGVLVFTRSTRGAMAEAALGSQKFHVNLDSAPPKKPKKK
jgi:lipid-binding SYLF domain-containing protein